MDLSTPEHLQIVDHLLTTTRSVRKRLNLKREVEPEVIETCLNIATQAPTASNSQRWHFVVITDACVRLQIAHYYREVAKGYFAQRGQESLQSEPGKPDPGQMQRVLGSAQYLAEHIHEVPVHIIPCLQGRVDGKPAAQQAGFWGSIMPAAWSLMLALRARGLGSAWTSFHLAYEKEVAELLGIPENVTQAALLPVAYYEGEDFRPAKRLPIDEHTHWNQWGKQR